MFPKHKGYAYGEIEIKDEGYGFVRTSDSNEIYIDASNLNGALDKDLVVVSDIDVGSKGGYRGSVNRVIKRNNGVVIFEVIGNSYDARLKPYNPNNNILVSIKKSKLRI